MRVTIDNGDGLGAVDYTAAICAAGRVRVERVLNGPATCMFDVVVAAGGVDGSAGLQGAVVRVPVRRGRAVVARADGTVLFTGYVATEPEPVYAGAGVAGPVYRYTVRAISDEWVLDRAGAVGSGGAVLSSDAGAAVTLLTSRAGNGASEAALEVEAAGLRAASVLATPRNAVWSEQAGAAASAVYASYRALAGQVMLLPAAAVTHALSDADGTLTPGALISEASGDLANDVAVTGEMEPAEFVTEEFTGDGTTSVFPLSGAVYAHGAGVLVEDAFGSGVVETAIDAAVWSVSDPGSHLALTAAGLTMTGGTGADGATLLTAWDAVELGGCVVAQMAGVSFGAASEGVLSGLYAGEAVLANCALGWRVRQSVSGSGSATVLVPVVNGAEVGTAFTPVTGHLYTLRLRVHCAEVHRVGQVFYSMADGVVSAFGNGAAADAGLDVVFELIDEGNAANTPSTVLYDSAASTGPVFGLAAKCTFVAVNAVQMFGSVATVVVRQTGTAWVTSLPAGGAVTTRLIGNEVGTDCEVSRGSATTTGTVTFFAGRVPAVNERVTVVYRTGGRSVARVQAAASVAAEGVAVRWLGAVRSPVARNSVDCASAAAAVLNFATSRAAALKGTYAAVNPAADVWPGDTLAITSAGVTTSLLVRGVGIDDGGTAPETLAYRLAFANDWATQLLDGLGVRLVDVPAADALLPDMAALVPGTAVGGAMTLPPDLVAMTVTSVTASVLSLDTGVAAVSGGGFEVRRRDGGWGTLSGTDFVMRSPVRSFSVPRARVGERFYVKAYDASVPAVYARWCGVVVANSPVVS